MGEHSSTKPALPRNGTKGTASGGPGCVVLVPAAAATPEPLVRALAKRHAQVCVVSHPASVMAVLASGPYKNVVIDQSGPVPQLQQLLGAVKRYYPAVVCWRYEADANSKRRLQRCENTNAPCEDLASHTAAPVSAAGSPEPCDAPPIEGVAASRPLSPAADSRHHGLQYHDEQWTPSEDQLPEPLISRDELAMLIGPAWGDGDDEDSDLDAQRERDT